MHKCTSVQSHTLTVTLTLPVVHPHTQPHTAPYPQYKSPFSVRHTHCNQGHAYIHIKLLIHGVAHMHSQLCARCSHTHSHTLSPKPATLTVTGLPPESETLAQAYTWIHTYPHCHIQIHSLRIHTVTASSQGPPHISLRPSCILLCGHTHGYTWRQAAPAQSGGRNCVVTIRDCSPLAW